MPSVYTKLIDNLHFVTNDGQCQDYHMKANDNQYTTPMRLILMGLTGCSGMDVISIARKMQQDIQEFSIQADAENAQQDPHVYTKILLTYTFKGNNLAEAKLKRAIELSLGKYCSVSAMLKSTAKIDYKIVIN